MPEIRNCPRCGKPLPPDAPENLCPECLLAAVLNAPGEDSGHPAAGWSTTTPGAAAAAPPDVADLAPLFPQLQILELIGSGGMGAVYKARQSKLDRIVALKIIRPEAAADPSFAERFNREARTLARLSHPQIISIHDFGETRSASGHDLFYFVMEYVDGRNLRQLLQDSRLSPRQTLALIEQICDALQYAHDEGVIHRDIKPENILIDQRGRVKIADFGLAKLAAGSGTDWTLTGTHQVMGTPRYMAPEQMEGSRSVDHRADIYSVGVMFYEMLTGQVPAGHFEPPSAQAGVDPGLDAIVLKAMARDPDRRFQRAGELRSSVSALTANSPPESSLSGPPPAPASTGRPKDQSPALSAILSREAVAAIHWVRGSADDAAVPHGAPRWLMLLLILIPAAMLFFPWFDIYVTDPDATRGLDGTFLTFHNNQTAWHDVILPLEMITCNTVAVLLSLLFVFQAAALGRTTAPRWAAVISVLLAALVCILLMIHRVELKHQPITVFGDPDTGAPPRNVINFGSPPGVGNAYLQYLHHEIEYRSAFFVTCGCVFVLLVLTAAELRHAFQAHARQRRSIRPGARHDPASRAAFWLRTGAVIQLLCSGVILIGMFLLVSTIESTTPGGPAPSPKLAALLLPALALLQIPMAIVGFLGAGSLNRGVTSGLPQLACTLFLLPVTPAWLFTGPIGLAVLTLIRTIPPGLPEPAPRPQ